jgi:hypothetical protein
MLSGRPSHSRFQGVQYEQERNMKSILGIHDAPRPHWVGDGFPVRSLFDYGGLGRALSPFLLLDYAGPAHFDHVATRLAMTE